MGTTRLRLSQDKASLITRLTDANVSKLLRILEDGHLYEIPQEEEAPAVRYPDPFTTGDPDNVLVIGDLHAPFIRTGYLEFCLEQQRKYNAGTVICIGDVVDNHAISYHEADPDGMSAGDEYKAAKACLKKLFHMFPKAVSLLGNHDLLIARKAKTAGLSKHFVRSLGEVYEAPDTWSFVDTYEKDDVLYQHGGAGGNALRVATHSRRSTVQGHLHAEFFTQYLVSERDAIFAVQAGSGIDDKAYAFAYGRPFPRKSAVGCSVILDKGKIPLNLLMPL